MRTGKIVCLLLVLAGFLFIMASFQPKLRFADPSPDEPLALKRNYACYYDRIYQGDSRADALFFGASKTHHALDTGMAMGAYEAITGKSVEIFAFDTPFSNPDIAYFFFRDYLANNPAPRVAFFSLTWVGPRPPPVRYVHPLFADLAPPYLYLDILKSWNFVHHKIFAVSDFLQLLVRHIDLSLSRLLVARYRFVVPEGDNCSTDPNGAEWVAPKEARFGSFEELLEAEVEQNLPGFSRDEVGSPVSLFETYADNRLMKYFVRLASERLEKDQERTRKRHFWRRGPATVRSLDYYRRIVALGKANNVKIGFYYLPNILTLQPSREDVEGVAEDLGAPVYLLPEWYTRVSYHHYRDAAHVTPAFAPAYSVWFASLIEKIEEG